MTVWSHSLYQYLVSVIPLYCSFPPLHLCNSPRSIQTMASSRANTKIIVVGGGGTIGSSTALHLIRSGYKPSNITVLDVYPIPSPQSAGHDLNKIMGIRLRNKPDLQLSLEALDMWTNDELFKPFFHKVGMVGRPIDFAYLDANVNLD